MSGSKDNTVGIFYRRPRDFYLFENVCRRLPNAEFIVVPSFLPKVFLDRYKEAASNQYKHAAEFISSKNVRWRLGPAEEVEYAMPRMKDFFSPYSLLVDTYNSFFMLHPAVHSKKKVLYLYDNLLFGSWPAMSFSNIDLVLTTGSYFTSLTSPFVKTETVGNLYSDMDGVGCSENNFKLNAAKKTILYLPHEELFKSPASFSGAINELSNEYNVIVQLTQETAVLKRNVNLFSLNKKLTLLDEGYDVRSFKNSVDLVVTDDAFTALEWLLFGTRVILLDLWTRDFFVYVGGTAVALPEYIGAKLSLTYDAIRLKTTIKRLLQSGGNDTPSLDVSHFFSRTPELAYKKAAIAIQELINRDRTVAPPLHPLTFKPGDVITQSHNFYYALRPIFNSIEDITRETSLVKKSLKIIKTFFS